MMRQLLFSTLDLELHHTYDPAGSQSPWDVKQRVAADHTVLPLLPEDRFLCSFAHIFAGGYAAVYYSYKWSEVLSADAYAAFEEAGIEDAKAIKELGTRYRDTILALGGGTAPMEVFRAFRGREPDPAPLIRHNGLTSTTGLPPVEC
jgi:oligopeptidase A